MIRGFGSFRLLHPPETSSSNTTPNTATKAGGSPIHNLLRINMRNLALLGTPFISSHFLRSRGSRPSLPGRHRIKLIRIDSLFFGFRLRFPDP